MAKKPAEPVVEEVLTGEVMADDEVIMSEQTKAELAAGADALKKFADSAAQE